MGIDINNWEAISLGRCTQLGNDCLSSIHKLTSSKKLRFRSTSFVNKMYMRHVLNSSSLKYLDINYIKFARYGPRVLGKMSCLRALILHCDIQNKQFFYLNKLNNFSVLNVTICRYSWLYHAAAQTDF